MNTKSLLNPSFTLKKVLAASILALSLPLASVALAHDGGPDGGEAPHCERGARHGMDHSGLPPHLRALQLSDTQKDQIFTLMHDQAPAIREQHKQRMQLMQELRATSQTDQFNEAKVQQIAEKLASLDKQRIVAHARNEAKVFAILTPEQRAKAREFKMERHGFDHDDHEQPTSFKSRHSEITPRVM